MSTALARTNGNGHAIDKELVRRTVANGATDDELELYLYDCARRNVHPLDKLLHFTKRGGKYVAVTSIDLLRSRAADTRQLAGIDDAVFETGAKTLISATVTVYRITQGQRFAYTGTARWSEYNSGGQMWAKMPHTMLAKCAEALALRKAFPQELAGLYGNEEMDQAAEPARVNPHVNRAEDFVDVPAEGDPDRLPDGNPEIKALPKKNARADFEIFQRELNATKTIAELEDWGKHQADRLQTYPEDWRGIARGLFVQHKAALRAQEDKPPSNRIEYDQARDPDGRFAQGSTLEEAIARRGWPHNPDTGEIADAPTDPAELLKWADAQLAAVVDPGMMDPTWDFTISPHWDLLDPAQQEELQGIRRKHERRLGA